MGVKGVSRRTSMPSAAARMALRCIGARWYMLPGSCSILMAKILYGVFPGSQNHFMIVAETSCVHVA